MTFASQSDMETRFGDQELQLIAERNDASTYAGVIAAALQDADAEIIGLVGRAVTIDPLNPPLNLIRLACDIARYRLYGANPPEDVRLRYKDATAFLTRVGAGQVSLDGGAAAPTDIAASSMAAASEPGSRIFRRGL